MTTGYVITQIDYEYNQDKIYVKTGETPINIYLNKTKAKEALNDLNLEALVFSNLADYAENLSYIVKDLDCFKAIILKYTKNFSVPLDFTNREMFNMWFSCAAVHFKAEDKRKLLELVQVKFYNFTEVQINNEKVVNEENVLEMI